jgi:pimeloyl-ACP methyl ester carboxylesterase
MAHVVLVHGAVMDGSSWGEMIPALLDAGHEVTAVQLPLTGLADDGAKVRRAIDSVSGRTIVVGHNYGGAVMTDAARDAPNVTALVYVAAFAPDEGERVADLMARYPEPAGVEPYIVPDEYGFFTIDRAHFARVFAPDVDPATAAVMANAQGPTANAAFAVDTAGPPAWRHCACFYVVAESDQVIHPATQRWMAERIGAIAIPVAGSSHVAMLSNPEQVVDVVLAAAHVRATDSRSGTEA